MIGWVKDLGEQSERNVVRVVLEKRNAIRVEMALGE